MLRVGKMADYALVIMNAMAKQPTALLSMDALSQKTHLSMPTVRKLMRLLVNAGLVRSIRGAKGGYQLARLPELISVVHILSAVEGPMAITECCDEDASCELSGGCDMEPHWSSINQLVMHILENISLADLKQNHLGPLIDLQGVLQRVMRAETVNEMLCVGG
ncbi:MAG: SUF system Fe-S cluster assembly regulator [Gammaproteobacteria bacterium]|nr:MAG: SUF system Fe-S cluster assembly regulator [Gammaproteobacteria bacterium]